MAQQTAAQYKFALWVVDSAQSVLVPGAPVIVPVKTEKTGE